MICSICSTKKDGERLPKGWKSTDAIYCTTCWKERYVLRAIAIPVVKPLGTSWKEFQKALDEAWRMSTACANWMVSRLFACDEQRMPGQQKLGKMPKSYLYPEARAKFPLLPSRTVASMEQAIKGKYSSLRYKMIWKGEVSLPSMRFPQPFVASNQAWTPSYEPAGKDGGDLVPCISVALSGKDRWLLQLKGGRDWQGQLRDFRKFVNGAAIQGELAILEKRAGGRGNGTTGRDEGGQKKNSRVMVKMVGWFPREKRRPAEGSLLIRKDADALLVACRETERGLGTVRQWHWEHLRRWVAEHKKRLQRWSDDQKAEQRRGPASFASHREAACQKYHNRMASAQKELAHQVAELCRRQRVAEVVYDDTNYGYFGNNTWTWSAFEAALANKLNEYGVQFSRKGSDD